MQTHCELCEVLGIAGRSGGGGEGKKCGAARKRRVAAVPACREVRQGSHWERQGSQGREVRQGSRWVCQGSRWVRQGSHWEWGSTSMRLDSFHYDTMRASIMIPCGLPL